MFNTYCFSQSINFDQLDKEKWFRYNGGISANSIFYNGTANRQDITYYLIGNLNFNISGLYNIPLSFTYSNQEFSFPSPFNFNRLSLHPSYKWATAHIGDVSMTFSPYTLSGHQFTGVGFELNPEGKFQISAMYGRFLKATEYDSNLQGGITSYKRIGYGVKTAYDFEFMKLGVILFKASDNENSLEKPLPTELNLTPKDNTVLSFESDFRVLDKANIHIEYAISGITEDIRQTDKRSNNGFLSFLLEENITTNYYNALNASLNYPAGNGSLGVGYERIDPDYKTLGAYYFNNDLENITINANQTIFNNKLSLGVNAGLQQDNLDKEKTSDQQRIVSAINANLTASERLVINSSYSNFQSYTNIRDQFDYINQVGNFNNVDTLNYRQISQNASLGVNYILKKTEQKQQSTNLNLVYQNSNNQQEGETIESGISTFYNGNAAYTLGYPQENLTFSLAANTSYNIIGVDKSLTLGPTLAVGKQFFEKKLRTNLSTSYNSSYSNGEQLNSVYNFRLGSNYVWLEKHNFNLNFLMLFRNATSNSNRDLTLIFGYSYAFDNFKPNLKKRERNIEHKLEKTNTNIWNFRYRNVSYSGTLPELNKQLTNVFGSSQFAIIPNFKKDDLSLLLAITKEQTKEEPYKENALVFLKELYGYEDFQNTYEKTLFTVIKKIKLDMQKIDIVLERLFVTAQLEVVNHPLYTKKETNYTSEDLIKVQDYTRALKEQETRLKKLVGHRWMEEKFEYFADINAVKQPIGYLKEFKEKSALGAYKIFDQSNDDKKLEAYLENDIIDFYYKKSLDIVNPESFELKYINRN
tara:strand:- start:6724 stop:9156 length:2433 start_codon:yes stop_codon:yes gene_type:complete